MGVGRDRVVEYGVVRLVEKIGAFNRIFCLEPLSRPPTAVSS